MSESVAVRFDFRRPFRLPPETARALDACATQAAGGLAGWLDPRFDDGIAVAAAPVEILPFGEFLREVPRPCAAFVIADADARPVGAIEMDEQLAFRAIDRLLGGSGPVWVPQRPLTALERMVAMLPAERTLDLLSQAWGERLPAPLRLEGFESSPDALAGAGVEVPALLTTLELAAGEERTRMRLCVRADVFAEPSADNGRDPREEARRDALRPETRARIEGSLRGATLPITVRVPEFRVPLRTVAELTVGALIPTGHPKEAPLDVVVGGHRRFEGAPGKVGRNLAVRLLGPVGAGPDEPDPLEPGDVLEP